MHYQGIREITEKPVGHCHPCTPQSARLRATTWGTIQAPVEPVAPQRVRRRASRRSLRRSAVLGVGQSARPTLMPWLPRRCGAGAGGTQPVGEGGGLGGGVETLEQFVCGLGRERTSGARD